MILFCFPRVSCQCQFSGSYENSEFNGGKETSLKAEASLEQPQILMAKYHGASPICH